MRLETSNEGILYNKKTKPDFREQNKERIYIIDMPCPREQKKKETIKKCEQISFKLRERPGEFKLKVMKLVIRFCGCRIKSAIRDLF